VLKTPSPPSAAPGTRPLCLPPGRPAPCRRSRPVMVRPMWPVRC